MKPISSADIPWTELSEPPRFALRYRHLSRAVLGEDYRVGVAIEELPPGMQTAPAHYHLLEEEHVYILEGALTAQVGTSAFEMKAGDYICFPAGQKAGHCLVNNSDAICRYVMIGERRPNEVVVYPTSGKVLVNGLGRRAIFDLAATRSYWDGEETGGDFKDDPPFDALREAVELRAEPARPVSSDALEWRAEGEGRFSGRSKHLTDAAVGPDYHVGVLIESPAPGTRLCPTHYHMLEEEHALILEGRLTLILGDERFDMQAGDYVCFPAGRKVGHSLVNAGPGPCSYLMIGEHNPNEVCVYPDSNKVMVRALSSERDIFDMSAARRYWDGEQAG